MSEGCDWPHCGCYPLCEGRLKRLGWDSVRTSDNTAAPAPAKAGEQHGQTAVNDREPADFLQSLQGFAAMCETYARDMTGLTADDLTMLADKFRDAAFVVDQLQKLREALRTRVSDLIRDGLGEIGKREAAEARVAELERLVKAALENTWDDCVADGVSFEDARGGRRPAPPSSRRMEDE